MSRIQKKIAVSHDCGHDFINLEYNMPNLTPNERIRVLEKLSKRLNLVSNEQVLDIMPTLDIVKALSRRYGVVCNSVETDSIDVVTILMVCQGDQAHLWIFVLNGL